MDYYFFSPYSLNREDWKYFGHDVDLVTVGGHRAEFDGRRIFPVHFVMRHYISHSPSHLCSRAMQDLRKGSSGYMKTIKTSREFKGSPISIRALCGLEDRSLPLSMRDIVATDGVRHFSGKLSNGDVDCTWEMPVWQNGFWSVRADFRDSGKLAGDFFFAEFRLGSDQSVGTKLEGSILNVLDSRHLSLSKDGSDRWVRENWHTFEGSGPSVRLHVAPSVGGIVAEGFVALAAAGVFIFSGAGDAFAERFGAGRCPEQDPDGPACVHATIVPGEPEPKQ
jgi:hypothetical protein